MIPINSMVIQKLQAELKWAKELKEEAERSLEHTKQTALKYESNIQLHDKFIQELEEVLKVIS